MEASKLLRKMREAPFGVGKMAPQKKKQQQHKHRTLSNSFRRLVQHITSTVGSGFTKQLGGHVFIQEQTGLQYCIHTTIILWFTLDGWTTFEATLYPPSILPEELLGYMLGLLHKSVTEESCFQCSL